MKPLKIDVFSLPDLLPPDSSPQAAVFIDVLRATSVMTTALAAGAKRILPIAEAQQALRLRDRMIAERHVTAEDILTGGERKAVRIKGFDLGNSPSDYTPERVAGRTILFSTTNGTRAILSLNAPATQKFLASFLNAEAVTERIETFESVAIVCAGTDGQYTEEDMLLAGRLVDRLVQRAQQNQFHNNDSAREVVLNVEAETARLLWQEFYEALPPNFTAETLEKSLARTLRTSRGGQNLVRAGLTADIADVCRIDSVSLVPEYRMGEIQADH